MDGYEAQKKEEIIDLWPQAVATLSKQLQSAFNWSEETAISAVFAFLDAGIIKQGDFQRNFSQNEISLQVSPLEFDTLIRSYAASVSIASSATSSQVLENLPDVSNVDAISALSQHAGEDILPPLIVATWPTDSMHRDNHVAASVTSLRTAFEHLISKSTHLLRLASPFLDEDGVSLLRPQLLDAAAKGVTIQILTRIENEHRPNAKQTLGLLQLYEIFKEHCEVASFARAIRSSAGHEAIRWGLHAKLLIADNRQAYVGSGELRGRALIHNFEVGVVLNDPKDVKTIVELFDTIWDKATRPFTYEQCRKLIHT